MPEGKKPKRIRFVLGIFFALLLIANAVLNTLAVLAGVKSDDPLLVVLPADTSPAIRLLVFVICAGFSWLLGRWVYQWMINGEMSVMESANVAYVLLFYFLLTVATLVFIGVLNWFWLPVLFVGLLLFSVLTLWRLLGGAFTAGSVVAAFGAAFVTFYLLS